MINIEKCPVCNGINLTPHIVCIDHSVSHETFNIIRCKSCDLLMTSPQPTNQELKKYYASDAYISHQTSAKTLLDKIYLLIRNFTLKWKLSLIEKNVALSEKNVLDFGCGTGEFLRVAKATGWKTQGVEPSENARQQASPLISNDILSSLQEISSGKKFNTITLWHVLEHIPDLNTTLEKLKSLCAENGTIFIAVPNHRSWDERCYKENWAAYDVPRHLWHFSIQNMRILFEKNSLTLLKIIPMRLDAYYVSLLSEKYLNKGKFSVKGMIRAYLNALRSNQRAKKDMTYSSLIYVARK